MYPMLILGSFKLTIAHPAGSKQLVPVHVRDSASRDECDHQG